MIAFQYDASGAFLGETTAQESPLEPGVFLLPARCTFTAPPADVPSGLWPRWNGTAWALVKLRDAAPDPVAKLQAFLAENPDVAEIIGAG